MDSDGLADLLLTIPLLVTGPGRSGRVSIISSATGATIASLDGVENEVFGSRVAPIANMTGDNYLDLAVDSTYLAQDGTFMRRRRFLNGRTFAEIPAIAPPLDDNVGMLTDLNADGVVDAADTQALLDAAFMELGKMGDVDDDLDSGISDVQKIVLSYGSTLGNAENKVAVALPSNSFIQGRMVRAASSGVASRPVGGVLEFYSATTRFCPLVLMSFATSTPCPGGTYDWSGRMNFDVWGFFPWTGAGDISGSGWGADAAGCIYLIDGAGSLSIGGGGLVGHFSGQVDFTKSPYLCQWPFAVGSTTKGGFAGASIGIGFLQVPMFWPVAIMGAWDEKGRAAPSGLLGLGLGGAAAEGSVTRRQVGGPISPQASGSGSVCPPIIVVP